MTPEDAARLAKHGRKLLRRGQITHREWSMFDCMLWSCRAPGKATARVSYTRLSSLAHVARETIAKGLRKLINLKVLSRTKVRVLVKGGIGTRQDVTIYTLESRKPSEFAHSTVIKDKEILIAIDTAHHETIAAQGTLQRLRDRRMALLNAQWLTRNATAG